MFVQVDTTQTPPVVTLEEPDDTKSFQLTVVGNAADVRLVYGALVDAAAGRLEGEHAWIAIDAVRRMAAGRTGPTWDADFAAMLEFATSKGWVDDTGASVRAHVEFTA